LKIPQLSLDYGPSEQRVTDDEISKIFADPEWGGKIDLDAFVRLSAVMLAAEGPDVASKKAFDLLCDFAGNSQYSPANTINSARSNRRVRTLSGTRAEDYDLNLSSTSDAGINSANDDLGRTRRRASQRSVRDDEGENPGYLDEASLKKIARDVGLGGGSSVLSEEDIRRVVFAWDKDEDGVINEEDFTGGMQDKMLSD